jgi:hypothetical protein
VLIDARIARVYIVLHEHHEKAGEGRQHGIRAEKAWNARYLRDLLATRSSNIRPEGIIPNRRVAEMEMKNRAMTKMRGRDPPPPD